MSGLKYSFDNAQKEINEHFWLVLPFIPPLQKKATEKTTRELFQDPMEQQEMLKRESG